jgi:hypothetical protein
MPFHRRQARRSSLDLRTADRRGYVAHVLILRSPAVKPSPSSLAAAFSLPRFFAAFLARGCHDLIIQFLSGRRSTV